MKFMIIILNVLPPMNNESVKHRFSLRILAIHSNPDGITRNKVGLDAEIRGPPVYTGFLGISREMRFTRFFGILPDIYPKCFTNVLPSD